MQELVTTLQNLSVQNSRRKQKKQKRSPFFLKKKNRLQFEELIYLCLTQYFESFPNNYGRVKGQNVGIRFISTYQFYLSLHFFVCFGCVCIIYCIYSSKTLGLNTITGESTTYNASVLSAPTWSTLMTASKNCTVCERTLVAQTFRLLRLLVGSSAVLLHCDRVCCDQTFCELRHWILAINV